MQLFFMLIYLSVFQAFSQNKISGKVKDEKNNAAGFVTVSLYKSQDSTFIKATLCDINGVYNFENVVEGNYILLCSMIGYQKTYSRPFELTKASEKSIEIQILPESKLLQEVTVNARKPFLEQKVDKLVVNIAGTLSSMGLTALEVMQRVPGLVVINDGVSMVGKSSVTVMIDGRSSKYTDVSMVLRTLQSSNIEKIEVISNPSAKFDASGGGIINIIMKKNANLGTNGSFSLTGKAYPYSLQVGETNTNRWFTAYSPGISLNHRKGQWNLFGNYNYSNRYQFEQTELNRFIKDNVYSQKNFNPSSNSSNSLSAGADFSLNNKNTFGALISWNTRNELGDFQNFTQQRLKSNNELISEFSSLNSQETNRTNYAYNLNWKHNFDSTGHELNIDFDQGVYDINSNNNFRILYKENLGTVTKNTQTVINPVNFKTFKVDYSLPFINNQKIELGLKLSDANIDYDLKFTQNEVIDVLKTNQFLYTEKINSVYLTYFKKWRTWDLQIGMRAEQTIAQGNSGGVNVLDRNYWQPFPSVFISKKMGEHFTLIGTVGRRLNRPSYQQQNPFKFFMDPLTYQQGNPLLLPEMITSSKLGLVYDGLPFLSVSTNNTSDIIIDAPRQEGNITFTQSQNIASLSSTVFEVNFPLNFGSRITGFGGTQIIKNHYQANYLNENYDVSKWTVGGAAHLFFKVSETVSADLHAHYMSPFIQGFFEGQESGYLSFVIAKKMWNNRARLAFVLNDIFYTTNVTGNIRFKDIDLQYRRLSDSRDARLSFSYSFGNSILKSNRNRVVGSETEKNRVK